MLEITFLCDHPEWKKLLRAQRKNFVAALQQAFNALELPNKQFSVAISLISDDEMQQLNSQYRHKDKPTNVLSFPMIEDFSDLKRHQEPFELGDIVMAYETTFHEAYEQDKTMLYHTMHLLVHGLLHLFGYDHMNKKDAIEMEELEVSILAKLGITDPY